MCFNYVENLYKIIFDYIKVLQENIGYVLE